MRREIWEMCLLENFARTWNRTSLPPTKKKKKEQCSKYEVMIKEPLNIPLGPLKSGHYIPLHPKCMDTFSDGFAFLKANTTQGGGGH